MQSLLLVKSVFVLPVSIDYRNVPVTKTFISVHSKPQNGNHTTTDLYCNGGESDAKGMQGDYLHQYGKNVLQNPSMLIHRIALHRIDRCR